MQNAINTVLTIYLASSFFGFGAVAVVLAAPARLAIVASMLLMVAFSSLDNNHSDLDL